MKRREFLATSLLLLLPHTNHAPAKQPPSRNPRTLYWTASHGSWHNPQNWSTNPNGNGGAGTPTPITTVIITAPKNKESHVFADKDCSCANLTIGARVTLTINANLNFGDGGIQIPWNTRTTHRPANTAPPTPIPA